MLLRELATHEHQTPRGTRSERPTSLTSHPTHTSTMCRDLAAACNHEDASSTGSARSAEARSHTYDEISLNGDREIDHAFVSDT
eukprot:1988730-Pleurochrysis_carterae.AAC.4